MWSAVLTEWHLCDRVGLRVLALIAVSAAPAAAQARALEAGCVGAAGAAAAPACARIADAAAIVIGRSVAAAAAGNPVPGTPSTLGHRIPGTPRLGLSGRFTFVPVRMPDPGSTAGGNTTFIATAWSAEAVIGVTQGFAVLPTTGGFGALDVFGGGGVVHLPADAGFRGRKPGTWTVGARLGILRESFTAPGITLSGQYRSISNWNLGDLPLETSGAFMRAEATSLWSVRLVAGKRLTPVTWTVGAGRDHIDARVVLRVRGAGGPAEARTGDYEDMRNVLFASAAWTWVILTFTAEAGWQSGLEDAQPGAPGGGGAWGALAARLTF